jgi:predicted transcriptional regulator
MRNTMPKFEIQLGQEKTQYRTATLELEADDEAAALEKAWQMAADNDPEVVWDDDAGSDEWVENPSATQAEQIE